MLGLFLQGVTWISLSATVLSNVSVDNTLEMSKHFPSDLDLCTVACTMSLSVSLLYVHVPPVGDCPLASLFPVQLSHVWTLPPACHLLGLLTFMFLN